MSVRAVGIGLLAALVALMTTTCRPDDQRTDSVQFDGAQSRAAMPSGMPEQLDSGSVAYRADDFEAALEHYRRASEIGPDFAAGWFGLYMAYDALGREGEAQAALERAQTAAPGASLLHETGGDTVR